MAIQTKTANLRKALYFLHVSRGRPAVAGESLTAGTERPGKQWTSPGLEAVMTINRSDFQD
jgi:hypothetical protein